MQVVDFNSLSRDDQFYAEVWENIWLMDNHKWAFYIWMKFYSSSKFPRFSLVHADFHLDGINDFHSSPDEEEKLLFSDLRQLLEFVNAEEFIRYDSFIAPAVLWDIIGEIDLFTKEEDSAEGIDEGVVAKMQIRQFVHSDIASLSGREISSPIIFDLCLDLFNKESKMMDKGDIWPEYEIIDFLNSMKGLIQRAQLITISLSFGYSGSEDDTRRLARLVLPTINSFRQCN